MGVLVDFAAAGLVIATLRGLYAKGHAPLAGKCAMQARMAGNVIETTIGGPYFAAHFTVPLAGYHVDDAAHGTQCNTEACNITDTA